MRHKKLTYTEKVCWPGGVQGPPIPLLLMLRVKTTIDKEFPIRPMPETMVKRMHSPVEEILGEEKFAWVVTITKSYPTLWVNFRGKALKYWCILKYLILFPNFSI